MVVVVGGHLQLGLRSSKSVTITMSRIIGRRIRLTASAWVSSAHPSLLISASSLEKGIRIEDGKLLVHNEGRIEDEEKV